MQKPADDVTSNQEEQPEMGKNQRVKDGGGKREMEMERDCLELRVRWKFLQTLREGSWHLQVRSVRVGSPSSPAGGMTEPLYHSGVCRVPPKFTRSLTGLSSLNRKHITENHGE